MIGIKCFLIIPVVIGPTEFQDRVQCAFINTFSLIRIETELLFVTAPALLALVAVVVVSVYALKLQIRLSREIQPVVNLPTENIIPTQRKEQDEEGRTTIETIRITTKKNENIALDEIKNTSEISGSSTHFNDIQIIDLEIANTEKITPEIIPADKNILEEEQESSFSIKRINSDPNHFFRIPREARLPPVTTGCFTPLAMIVERILMINIPALCLALNLIFAASMRLYFVLEDKEAAQDTVLGLSFNIFQVIFVLSYVFLVRKKLCKQ